MKRPQDKKTWKKERIQRFNVSLLMYSLCRVMYSLYHLTKSQEEATYVVNQINFYETETEICFPGVT